MSVSQISYSLDGFGINSIDLTSSGSVELFSTSSSQMYFLIKNILVRINSVSNFVSVATISLGTNASSYNNILTATPLTNLTTENTFINIPTSIAIAVPENSQIFANVTVPAVASSMQASIVLTGVLHGY